MRHIALVFLFFYLHIHCMENIFDIKQITYDNECHHHVQEYRMGNILVSQTTDPLGNVLHHAGKIIRVDDDDQILGPETAQSTFTKLTHLIEVQRQFLAQRAERHHKILGIKG